MTASLNQDMMERTATSDGKTNLAADVTILVFRLSCGYQVGLLMV